MNYMQKKNKTIFIEEYYQDICPFIRLTYSQDIFDIRHKFINLAEEFDCCISTNRIGFGEISIYSKEVEFLKLYHELLKLENYFLK